MKVLDLFSAAAGGWSLGMHRAGFTTIAACEAVEWRRVLYAQNNPAVRIYDDVRTLTADRLVRDGVGTPDLIVGSPPCQDISSANTKGQGVDGARSGLFFEAVRLIGECRPRWFSLENSANLRTRGADRVLGALEDLGYACWPLVVRARDVGANHERPRCWIVGCDPDQVAGEPIPGLCEWTGAFDAGGASADAMRGGQRQQSGRRGWSSGTGSTFDGCDDPSIDAGDAKSNGRTEGRSGRCSLAVAGLSVEACWNAYGSSADPNQAEWRSDADSGSDRDWQACERSEGADRSTERASLRQHDADAVEVRLAGIGRPEARRWEGQGEHSGHPSGQRSALDAEMGGCTGAGGDAVEPWADWNGGLAGHLRVDDGLSARLAGTRVAVGGGRGTSASALVVEAFGDAVIPQIPEAIGAAIWRVEAAMAAVREAA